ncbi:MAG: hypothetical protein TREMPRED_003022, partial [Tremellales sp. Tagirdzhanova-0007]
MSLDVSRLASSESASDPPAFSSESAPQGSILINVKNPLASLRDTSPEHQKSPNSSSEYDIPPTPVSPLYLSSLRSQTPPSILSPPAPSTSVSPNASTPRIRFAPLPNAHRPRSLSTGRNVVWKASLEPNGQRTRAIAIRGNDEGTDYKDEDVALDDEEDDEGAEGDGRLGRVLGKTMSGSWRGTKKLLGYSTSAL